jgi:Ca2+-binding EF-hand superfamily protein
LGSGNSDAGGSESGDDSAKFAALNDLRRALRLESSTVDELITVFQACEDESGNISKRSFERCLRALMLSKGASEADLARCRPLCDRLFATFDADGNGVVDHTELLTGISVLCAGSQDDKVRAMFELYGGCPFFSSRCDRSASVTSDALVAVCQTKMVTASFRWRK